MLHVRSIGRITGSRVQRVGSVHGCSAADLPCRQITHSCLVLGVKLTAHESRAALREWRFALVSISVLGEDAGKVCSRATAGGVPG